MTQPVPSHRFRRGGQCQMGSDSEESSNEEDTGQNEDGVGSEMVRNEIRVFEAMSQRPGRYSQVTKRGIEENSFQGVPLHTGRASDRNLDQREFFGSLAWNLEKRMLSQGKDQKGYIKLIDDLKVLYPQYWPQDAAALFGEGEVETLCQKLGM
ncbi:hypothetical protein D5F01_LYC22280 [Larimichthys crocea]|uniref:Uncharacterized protein n=1 Tax=Larimichthys crocea TaxID=215358 RepID=A0A6G0HLV1_LARCR|nr:hypothetical protein D5F01_LYC22280 [Larimichthys crocea]